MTLISGDPDWGKVGAAVRDRMAGLGITTGELARRSALSAATVRAVLRGSGQHQRRTLNGLGRALGWPPEYLAAIAAGTPPPAVPASGPATAQGRSVPLAEPVAVLIGLADFGHGASLQAEANAMAARVAAELSQGMTPAQRIAVHEFLSQVAAKVRWPRW